MAGLCHMTPVEHDSGGKDLEVQQNHTKAIPGRRRQNAVGIPYHSVSLTFPTSLHSCAVLSASHYFHHCTLLYSTAR